MKISKKVLLILGCIILFLGLFIASQISKEKNKDRALKEILGSIYSKCEVIECEEAEKPVFGRNAIAWHIDCIDYDKDFIQGMTPSDKSDLEFAKKAISSIIEKPKLNFDNADVFRKEIGEDGRGDTAYIVVSPGDKDIYIYLFRP